MQPVIFDRALYRARRNRAGSGFAQADFLLAEMAERLADRLEDITRRFPFALELGCHRGLLARALAGRGGIAQLVQMDGAVGMLDGAGGLRVAGEEELLPFAPDTFDLVLSCGALHRVNDLPGTLIQIHRALKPDGLFLAVLPGGETLWELRDAFLHAELAASGGAAPRIAPFLEVREAGGLLQRAGFALPVAEVERLTVRYEHALALLRDLRAMGEANALTERSRTPLTRRLLAALAQEYAARHGGPDGRIPASFDWITLTGWKPHASQPLPARRGSGKVSLRDALE